MVDSRPPKNSYRDRLLAILTDLSYPQVIVAINSELKQVVQNSKVFLTELETINQLAELQTKFPKSKNEVFSVMEVIEILKADNDRLHEVLDALVKYNQAQYMENESKPDQ